MATLVPRLRRALVRALQVGSGATIVVFALSVLRQLRAINDPSHGFVFAQDADGLPLPRLRRAAIDVLLAALAHLGALSLPLSNPRFALALLRANAGPHVRRNVAYGAHPLQRLDVHLPLASRCSSCAAGVGGRGLSPPLPVLLLVHGGAWAWGDKLTYSLLARGLADAVGAVVLCVGYRVYPTGNGREQTADVVDALAWAAAPGGLVEVREREGG